jgi:hypothetical protein
VAKTFLGFISGNELQVDGAVDEVRTAIDRASRGWVTLTTTHSLRLDVAVMHIAYLRENREQA